MKFALNREQFAKRILEVCFETNMYSPVGTRGLSRECVLRIPMRVVKGDYNGAP